MYTDEEIKEYSEQLQKLGISEVREQKEVLDYFYQLGKIIYLLPLHPWNKSGLIVKDV